jgi:serine/threonine-protein kinase
MSGARRRFRFIKEIAEGGFGKVFLAEQLSQDGFSRIVALKLLHQKWSSHDEVVMRTRDEARLLGLIRHQHIVRVEDLTSIDGKLAIVMEYLEGVDLKLMISFLKEKGLVFPRQALFEILIGVAGALDAAYNGEPLQGGEPLRVIHRDIKPSNIFVTINGGIKVLDFGTARANFESREAKTQALAFGSQGYMAPERMLGEEDTPAADIFSLGVTLSELLTLEPFGRIPPRPNKFLAKVEEKVAEVRLEGDPEWCDQVRETLRLMLAYEASERPTARQLTDIFEILAQGAQDMGARRFCRTLVAEAKAAMPELENADPLTGSVIEEDSSSVWGIDSAEVTGKTGSETFSMPNTKHNTPPPAPVSSRGPSPEPGPKSGTKGAGSSAPKPAAAVALQEQTDPDDDEPPKKKGGGFLRVAIILVVLLLLLGLVGGGIAAAGLAAVFLIPSAPSVTDTASAPAEDPVKPSEPEPPKVELPNGSKVVTPDKRKDAPASKKTTLKVKGNEPTLVVVTGGVGYKAEWDGKAPFDLGPLAKGKYRTLVTPVSSGEKLRLDFEVVEGKACEYTFDPAKKAWAGGCT